MSFYTRPLPKTVLAFTHDKSAQLLAASIIEGNAKMYFTLSQQYLTQDEPAYCGIATLCMILNAAGIDPLTRWKGVWRWYDQAQLNCCRPLASIQKNGITMAEFVCLAKCNGLSATSYSRQNPEAELETFRADVRRSCRSDRTFIAVSFDRQVLAQSGSGHFSPIAAYQMTSDGEEWILVLDVARFKYPAYWCPLQMMWDAMNTFDEVSGLKRGYAILSTESCEGKDEMVMDLVKLNINKHSLRTLQAMTSHLASTVISAQELMSLDLFKDYHESVTFVSITDVKLSENEAYGEADVLSPPRPLEALLVRQQELLQRMSLSELFATAYLEFMGAPSAKTSSAIRQVIDSIKVNLEALRICCQSENANKAKVCQTCCSGCK